MHGPHGRKDTVLVLNLRYEIVVERYLDLRERDCRLIGRSSKPLRDNDSNVEEEFRSNREISLLDVVIIASPASDERDPLVGLGHSSARKRQGLGIIRDEAPARLGVDLLINLRPHGLKAVLS